MNDQMVSWSLAVQHLCDVAALGGPLLEDAEHLRQLWECYQGEVQLRQRAEAEAARLRAGIEQHRDQRGDDRCWIDDVILYGLLGDNREPDLTLPDKQEFLRSCERYWKQRQLHIRPYTGCMTIGQLEQELRRLREVLEEIGRGAYRGDETHHEYSARVRRLARQALE